MQLSPDALKALLSALVPLIDTYVAQSGSAFVKVAWPFIKTFLVNADPVKLAAAHAALPAEHKVA